jgi:tetratricopeptide (TPR) repeat protein
MMVSTRLRAMSANVEAIGHLAKALEILTKLPETQDRVRQELDLQTSLGPALMVARGIAAPEVERAYVRALQLARQLADDRLTFTATEGLWSVCLLRAELQRALELAERCWALAERSGAEALLLEAHSGVGQTLFYRGDFVAAREHLEAGIALYDVERHRAHALVHGEDPGVGCRLHAGWALWSLGYPDRALMIGQEALALAENLTHPTTRAYALGFLSVIHQLRGEARGAQDRAEAMIALATENAMPFWLAMATVRRGSWRPRARMGRHRGDAEGTCRLAGHGCPARNHIPVGPHRGRVCEGKAARRGPQGP